MRQRQEVQAVSRQAGLIRG
ncbi:hypothetical protein N8Z00_29045 [Achromobacter spanius]|nr:hypothetical protein N8Z00_29045 [Achromobacter spanius]WEX97494.1 hypothetical protein N3Z32_23645 [Achromobacter sp. SS2-2022]